MATALRRPVRRWGIVGAVGAVIAALALSVSIANVAFAATLFSDDFSDGDTSGWSKSGGEWSVVTDGSPAVRQSKLDSELARFFAGSTSWTNYTVQARVKPLAFDGSNRYVGLAARASGSTTFYRIALLNADRAELQAVNSGQVSVLGSLSRSVATGTWYTLRIEVSGTTIRGFVDGTAVGSAFNSMEDAGRIGLQTFHATASFDDVLVTDSAGPGPTTGGPTTGTPPTSSAPTSSPPTSSPPSQPQTGLVGWATQGGGTTGGGTAAPTTVTTASALTNALSATNAAVIRITGTISCSGMLRVASNKTILGNSGATITGCGLNISQASNVIVRNLTFRGWNDDAINVQYSTRVWIDHNSFSDGADGAVDVKRASDFVTISWNRVFAHDKSMLLGHSDDNASEDQGHLRVTYHHNYFDGSGTRHPRVRFGNPVHVYNNYYRDNEYGVASTMGAGVLVEGNYFEAVDEPTLVGYADSDDGAIVQRNNVFVGSGTPESGGGSVASIPYSYQLESADNARTSVLNGAGAGRISV